MFKYYIRYLLVIISLFFIGCETYIAPEEHQLYGTWSIASEYKTYYNGQFWQTGYFEYSYSNCYEYLKISLYEYEQYTYDGASRNDKVLLSFEINNDSYFTLGKRGDPEYQGYVNYYFENNQLVIPGFSTNHKYYQRYNGDFPPPRLK